MYVSVKKWSKCSKQQRHQPTLLVFPIGDEGLREETPHLFEEDGPVFLALGLLQSMELDKGFGVFPDEVEVHRPGRRSRCRWVVPSAVLGDGDGHLAPGCIDHLEGVPVSSSGRALIRCFTWMNPTSPLAMNRCWRLRSASLPWDSRRGLLTLKVFMHVSSRVRLSSEISRGWSSLCGASGQCSLSVNCPGDRGKHPCSSDRLEESHCSECRWLCRESMVAICEVKIPGAMVTCFLRAVPSVRKILHCGVALSCHFSLDSPWDLLGDQQYWKSLGELFHIFLLVRRYGLRRCGWRWCSHASVP